jgi:hypothetical protein
MIGDVTVLNNQVFVEVNNGGTLQKLGKPKWFRILKLFIYQAIGKKKHLQEVIEYLTTAST